MTKSSDRAKRNFTKQLKLQLDFLQDNLAEKQKTLKKIQKYSRYRLPGYKHMLSKEISGITKVKNDISKLKMRIRKRQKLGQINKIL